MTLRQDDFRVGGLAVISGGDAQDIITPYGIEQIENRRLNGNVVRIVAVSLPFVVVDFLGTPIIRKALDARCWEFSRVTREYVEALHPEVFGPPAATSPPIFAQQPITEPQPQTQRKESSC